MKKETIVIDVQTDKAVKNIDKLNDSVKETGKETKNTSQDIDKVTGGAASKFKNLTSTVGGVIKSFKNLRVAIIASGIGALVLAVTAVGQAFTRSEEGQNKFAKIMAVIGSVTGNLLDILADLGESIISVFEDPKQALIDFKDAFIQNITNRFNSALKTIGFLGSAIKKVFKGDFKGAMEDAKSAGSSYIDTLTGVNDTLGKTTEAVKSLKNEIIEEGKISAKIADDRAKADEIERKNIVDRANANQKISELRFKAEQRDKFSAAERVKFLKEASALEEETTNKEIEAAKLRFEAKKLENELTKSTKADKDEEARLEAQLIALTTSKLNLQKRLQTSITTFQNEQKALKAAELKEQEDEEKAAADKEKAEIEKLKKESEERIKIEQEEAVKKTQAKEMAFNQAVSIAGAESKLGKALLIAKQIQSAKELAIEVGKTITFSTQAAARSTVAIAEGTAQTAKIGFPQNIPMLIGYAAQAVGIFSAIRSATSKAKAPLSLPSSSNISSGVRSAAPTTTPQTPSFNIAGQGGTNQLAEAIGSQSQQPIKAYVVSSDVTTSQELDRNIIESASL
jgi:hypothetical protein